METKKYRFLDSLRGLAVIMVLISHLHFIGAPIYKGSEVLLIGVSLFFIISSYTLSLSQDKKLMRKNMWKDFYLRRFFRIYPLFFCIITITYLASFKLDIFSSIHEYTSGFLNYITHITFTYGFSPYTMNTFHIGEWSLFSEAIFYLIFPILFLLIRKSWRNTIIVSALSVIIYKVWDLVAMGHMFEPYTNKIFEWWLYVYHFPLYHLPDFMMGFILFHLHRIEFGKYFAKKWLYIISIGHALLFSYIIYLNISGTYINHLIWIVLFGILIWIMMVGGGIYQIINNKFLVYVGERSYSLYLLNLPLFFIASSIISTYHVNAIWGTIITVGILFILSAWTYKIELWGIQYGKKYMK